MTAGKSYDIDPNSETWREIEQWIEERLQVRRSNLESMGTEINETENCRGAIEELNELQQLARPHVVEEPSLAEAEF